MACANEPDGRGWTPIFGGSSASWTSATIVCSASRRRSSSEGIAAATSVAERYRSGSPPEAVIDPSLAAASMVTMATDHTQSLANLRLERDAILLYDALASIEKEP